MSRFKRWMEEYEAGLGQSPTPASDEVKNTGLQPQVDMEDVASKTRDDDAIAAIDSVVERIRQTILDFPKKNSSATSHFRKLWDELEENWEQFKSRTSPATGRDFGLGSSYNDKEVEMMRNHPNMVPVADQAPNGPGTFGNM